LNGKAKLLTLGCWLFFGAAVLSAGDCSDPSDCNAIPDNVTRGAVVISVFAGAALAVRSQNGDSEEDGSDELTDPEEATDLGAGGPQIES
jgi:hypothetical protein